MVLFFQTCPAQSVEQIYFPEHEMTKILFDAEAKHIYLIKQMFCLFACFYSNNPAMPKIISLTNSGMKPLNVKLFGAPGERRRAEDDNRWFKRKKSQKKQTNAEK